MMLASAGPMAAEPFDGAGGRVTKFAFASAERGNHAVATLCRIVGISVSGFYAWLRAIPAVHRRAETEADLRGHIDRIFTARRRVYGSPRIHAELRREGRRHERPDQVWLADISYIPTDEGWLYLG
jgi:hypothetical protein